MTQQQPEPYNFARLDDMYLTADEYDKLCGDICREVEMLKQAAWGEVESQSTNDKNEYIKKLVVAQWRDIEMGYAEKTALRRGRLLKFHDSIMLVGLLSSIELGEDARMVTVEYTREELLALVNEASAPWCRQYNLRLDYDTEIDHADIEWEIYIDAIVD